MRPANNQSAGKGERYPRPGEAYTPSYAPPQAARSHAPVDSGRHGSTGGSRPPGKGSRAGGGAGKSKSVPRWILIVLDILIVAVICAGIYFLAVPKIVEWKAEKLKQQILEDLKKNPDQAVQVKIPRGYGAVPGEDYEDGFGTVFVGNDADQLTNDEEVTLTYVGRMVIPKIGVSTPVSNDHSLPALRFGVGILTWEEAAALPDPGLTTIFGHRYITKGRDFNRLDEIRVGDTFFIDYNPTGTRYHYEVDNTMIIPAEELQAHVVEPWNEKKLMLVTCHPITYLYMTERILVYAHPTREEPIPK